MGEYLSLLNKIKESVYAKDCATAVADMKKLLNNLNIDYTSVKNAADREKARGVIIKLLPVLNDLKRNEVTQTVINGLKLDPQRLATPSLDDLFGENRLDSSVFGMAPSAPVSQNPANVSPQPVQSEPQPTALEQPTPQPAQPTPQPTPQPTKPLKHGARRTLAPLMLDDYIGQEKAKAGLRISIKAAKKENRPLAHTLICSSYGLGKTTLANIIANEMDMPFFSVNATNLKDVKSLSLYFSKIQDSCIVFIDEIHSLKNDVQTVLLSILTDYAVSFINEAGEEITYELPPFTLIGATTQAGELLKPFLNRFTVLELLDYTDEEKAVIVRSKFKKMGYEITDEAVADVARRSRGIPRTIETYAKGIKDIALNDDVEKITEETTKKYFDMYDIDALGLGANDLRILKILADSPKPIALVTMESKTGIQKEDLAYRYEPYLIKLGFMDKTDRGRVITEKGRKYVDPSYVPVQTEEPATETAPEAQEQANEQAQPQVPASESEQAQPQAPAQPVQAPQTPTPAQQSVANNGLEENNQNGEG
ncbi:MAG: AAA family ATPase [Clostridia bacterium]|nr:AAA family ATPase [Clostridia bacterium]